MISYASDHDRDRGVYDVRRPRASDAVGGALLRCYGPGAAMPADMRRLLDRIDRPRG